jgi:hypothetical protein
MVANHFGQDIRQIISRNTSLIRPVLLRGIARTLVLSSSIRLTAATPEVPTERYSVNERKRDKRPTYLALAFDRFSLSLLAAETRPHRHHRFNQAELRVSHIAMSYMWQACQ